MQPLWTPNTIRGRTQRVRAGNGRMRGARGGRRSFRDPRGTERRAAAVRRAAARAHRAAERACRAHSGELTWCCRWLKTKRGSSALGARCDRAVRWHVACFLPIHSRRAPTACNQLGNTKRSWRPLPLLFHLPWFASPFRAPCAPRPEERARTSPDPHGEPERANCIVHKEHYGELQRRRARAASARSCGPARTWSRRRAGVRTPPWSPPPHRRPWRPMTTACSC